MNTARNERKEHTELAQRWLTEELNNVDLFRLVELDRKYGPIP